MQTHVRRLGRTMLRPPAKRDWSNGAVWLLVLSGIIAVVCVIGWFSFQRQQQRAIEQNRQLREQLWQLDAVRERCGER